MKNEFLDIIPRIRVYEKKLINPLVFSRMLDSTDISEVFKTLSETTYGENVDEDINILNYDKVLSVEFKKLFKSLREIINNEELVEIFLKKYKYNNLKFMLKAKFMNVDLGNELFDIEGFDNEFIFSYIKSEDFNFLPEEFSGLVKNVCEDFEEKKDPQRIDIMVDREMFKNLLKISNNIKDDFLSNYIRVLIDVFNVKTLFRFKKLSLEKKLFESVIVDGGNISLNSLKSIFSEPKENLLNTLSSSEMFRKIKDGIEHYVTNDSLNILDKELDDFLIDYLKNAKIIVKGLAPIIGYINGKENEIKNIRIVLVGKINSVAPDYIRGRLRRNYA